MITEGRFKAPYYKTSIQIFVFDDLEEAHKELPSFPGDADGYIQCFPDDNCIHIVIPPDRPSVVVHELEHAKNSIWRLIHHEPDIRNDEPDAYLIEWLWKCAEKTINRHNKKLAT